MLQHVPRISLVVLLVLALSVPPVFAVPDEAQDSETYDLEVTGIFPDSDGRICATQIRSDLYRIKLVNSDVTGFQATLLDSTPRETQMLSNRVEIDGTLYMFTTGKNDAIQLLGITPEGACLTTDVEQSFSFDVYYLEGAELRPQNFTLVKQ